MAKHETELPWTARGFAAREVRRRRAVTRPMRVDEERLSADIAWELLLPGKAHGAPPVGAGRRAALGERRAPRREAAGASGRAGADGETVSAQATAATAPRQVPRDVSPFAQWSAMAPGRELANTREASLMAGQGTNTIGQSPTSPTTTAATSTQLAERARRELTDRFAMRRESPRPGPSWDSLAAEHIAASSTDGPYVVEAFDERRKWLSLSDGSLRDSIGMERQARPRGPTVPDDAATAAMNAAFERWNGLLPAGTSRADGPRTHVPAKGERAAINAPLTAPPIATTIEHPLSALSAAQPSPRDAIRATKPTTNPRTEARDETPSPRHLIAETLRDLLPTNAHELQPVGPNAAQLAAPGERAGPAWRASTPTASRTRDEFRRDLQPQLAAHATHAFSSEDVTELVRFIDDHTTRAELRGRRVLEALERHFAAEPILDRVQRLLDQRDLQMRI